MESTLHQQISAMKQSLLDEGFVDGHFVELELLEDGDNLHFTEEIITLFFMDSARLIVDVEKELNNDPIDYSKVDKILHQFKGSSSRYEKKKKERKSLCLTLSWICMKLR